MDNGNQGPVDPNVVQATINAKEQQLKNCAKDRSALEVQVGLLLKSFKTESLRVVEEILKYDPQLSSIDKQRLFAAYKNRILNEGGRCDRQLPIVLGDYIIEKVYDRKTETRFVGHPYRHPSDK